MKKRTIIIKTINDLNKHQELIDLLYQLSSTAFEIDKKVFDAMIHEEEVETRLILFMSDDNKRIYGFNAIKIIHTTPNEILLKSVAWRSEKAPRSITFVPAVLLGLKLKLQHPLMNIYYMGVTSPHSYKMFHDNAYIMIPKPQSRPNDINTLLSLIETNEKYLHYGDSDDEWRFVINMNVGAKVKIDSFTHYDLLRRVKIDPAYEYYHKLTEFDENKMVLVFLPISFANIFGSLFKKIINSYFSQLMIHSKSTLSNRHNYDFNLFNIFKGMRNVLSDKHNKHTLHCMTSSIRSAYLSYGKSKNSIMPVQISLFKEMRNVVSSKHTLHCMTSSIRLAYLTYEKNKNSIGDFKQKEITTNISSQNEMMENKGVENQLIVSSFK